MSKTVLVVDDSLPMLINLEKIVADQGYNVIRASSGKEAVAKAKSDHPDMIFMDIVMDDMDGYGACREIVKGEGTSDIPVVFVSTKHQKADRMWAERQGGKALITKPFTEEQIHEQLARFL